MRTIEGNQVNVNISWENSHPDDVYGLLKRAEIQIEKEFFTSQIKNEDLGYVG